MTDLDRMKHNHLAVYARMLAMEALAGGLYQLVIDMDAERTDLEEAIAELTGDGTWWAVRRLNWTRHQHAAVRAFVERVNRRALRDIEATSVIEGAHWRALEAELAALEERS